MMIGSVTVDPGDALLTLPICKVVADNGAATISSTPTIIQRYLNPRDGVCSLPSCLLVTIRFLATGSFPILPSTYFGLTLRGRVLGFTTTAPAVQVLSVRLPRQSDTLHWPPTAIAPDAAELSLNVAFAITPLAMSVLLIPKTLIFTAPAVFWLSYACFPAADAAPPVLTLSYVSASASHVRLYSTAQEPDPPSARVIGTVIVDPGAALLTLPTWIVAPDPVAATKNAATTATATDNARCRFIIVLLNRSPSSRAGIDLAEIGCDRPL
jgi:hypothetical protein